MVRLHFPRLPPHGIRQGSKVKGLLELAKCLGKLLLVQSKLIGRGNAAPEQLAGPPPGHGGKLLILIAQLPINGANLHRVRNRPDSVEDAHGMLRLNIREFRLDHVLGLDREGSVRILLGMVKTINSDILALPSQNGVKNLVCARSTYPEDHPLKILTIRLVSPLRVLLEMIHREVKPTHAGKVGKTGLKHP